MSHCPASGKTVINTNQPVITTKRFAQSLRTLGLPIQPASQGDDFGVTKNAARSRITTSAKKRRAKAKVRATRAGYLAKSDPRAQNLWQTGVDLQLSYETPSSGPHGSGFGTSAPLPFGSLTLLAIDLAPSPPSFGS